MSITFDGQKRIITALHIALKTITGREIADNTITGGTDGNLAEETITAQNIEAGTITANEIGAGSITGDRIDVNTITADNISTLDMAGKHAVFDTGTIGGWNMGANEFEGPVGSIIRSGQTDFSVGTGYWLGNVAGVPKFSVGSASGNKMEWDGTNLRITGALTPTTVFNTYTYTAANLPQPPSTIGFNSPSANE